MLSIIIVLAMSSGFVVAQQQPTGLSMEVASGTQLLAALADPSGPVELVLTSPLTALSDALFDNSRFQLPIMIWRNITIRGQPNRWPTLNLGYIKIKLQLANSVAMTFRYVVLSEYSDGANAAGGWDVFAPTSPDWVESLTVLRDGALLTDLCFPFGPSARDEDDVFAVAPRPPALPGTNSFQPTAEIPAYLQSDRNDDGGDGGCRNDSTAPPLDRCWAHVGHYVDFAAYALQSIAYLQTTAKFQLARNGILLHLLNVYNLCKAVLPADCVKAYGPVVCLIITSRQEEAKKRQSPSPEPVHGDPLSLLLLEDGSDDGGEGSHDSGGGDGGGLSTAEAAGIGVAVTAAVLLVATLVLGLLLKRRPGLRLRLFRQQGGERGGRKSSDNITTAAVGDDEVLGSELRSGSWADGAVERSKAAAGEPSAAAAVMLALLTLAAEAAGAAVIPTGNGSLDDQTMSSTVTEAPAVPAAEVAADSSTGPQEESNPETPPPQQQGCHDEHVVVHPLSPLQPDVAVGPECVDLVTLLPVVLGKGASGRVYEGMYGGQRVAVKTLSTAFDTGPGPPTPDKWDVKCWEQEVQVLGRCRHPNVVRLLAACVTPPRLCLVIELMEGSLQRLIFREPGQLIPLPTVIHIAIQVARGLEYLHPTIIHRDLKPANILVNGMDSPKPVVKLTDFGLATIRAATMPTMNPEAGTPTYLPPECYDLYNNTITHKADIYAFGISLWTMLTGKEPWEDYSLLAVAYLVTEKMSRPPMDILSEHRCPRKLRRLIRSCWEQDPLRRPGAAEAVKELLLLQEQMVMLSRGHRSSCCTTEEGVIPQAPLTL